MQSESVIRLYVDEVGRLPALTEECERIMSQRLSREHDAVAREVLVLANLRLAARIAMSFTNKGLALQSLLTEANVGLLRAVEEHDADLDSLLSASAAWWIRQTIRRALNKRLPSPHGKGWTSRMILRWQRANSKLHAMHGRPATLTELSKYLSISLHRLRALENACHAALDEARDQRPYPPLALEALFQEEVPADHNSTPTRPGHRPLRCLLRHLHRHGPASLRGHLGLMTGQPLTFLEIARRLGLSETKCRWTELQALRQFTSLAAQYRSQTTWFELVDDPREGPPEVTGTSVDVRLDQPSWSDE